MIGFSPSAPAMKAMPVATLVTAASYLSMNGEVVARSIRPKTRVSPLVRRKSRVNLRLFHRRQAASAMMARSEPRIAGLTPSVSARDQKTISGPNSVRTKRAVAASFGMERSFGSVGGLGQRRDDRLDRLWPVHDSHM